MKKETTSDTTSIWILENNRNITAGTTRRGIKDKFEDPYAGFSICHYTGDTHDNIKKCLKLLAEFLSTDTDRIIIPRQTHSANVHTVTSANASDRFPENCDALTTDIPGIVIGVNTADCVPVLLYDEERHIVGAAHAGWRGALNGIIGNTVNSMIALGSSCTSIHVIICPSIGVECFEVGEEVAELFPEKFVNRLFGIRPHIDLSRYVQSRLEECGIPEQQIRQTGICTRCLNSEYFSARILGTASGRNFSFIRLNEAPSDVSADYS